MQRTLLPAFSMTVALCAISTLALAAPPVAPAPAAPKRASLTWFGQSCFLFESPGGARLVTDPIPNGLGFPLPKDLKADAVTISHEHFDHTNVALVSGKPRVFRGLTPDKKGWVKVDAKVKDIALRTVGTYHDEEKGNARGLNAIFVFELGGLRVAHLGDLGHVLDDKQLEEIGGIDVVLVPVGGFFTIDAATATKVIEQLRPRLVVIPMHHKTATSTVKELATVDAFLSGKPNVKRQESSTLILEGLKRGASPQIVVLKAPG